MRVKYRPAAIAALALALASAAPAASSGDAQAGREKADAGRCFECHGADGLGAPEGHPGTRFPRLAGQRPDYIVKQLKDFASGARKHDVMRVMAQQLDDADRRDLAAYFAGLPPMRGADAAAPHSEAGAALYRNATGAAPSCAGCHGEAGRGVAAQPATPVLARQDAHYLARQLLDWRSGWRNNSADPAMSRAARALSEADVRALVAYLAGAGAKP